MINKIIDKGTEKKSELSARTFTSIQFMTVGMFFPSQLLRIPHIMKHIRVRNLCVKQLQYARNLKAVYLFLHALPVQCNCVLFLFFLPILSVSFSKHTIHLRRFKDWEFVYKITSFPASFRNR